MAENILYSKGEPLKQRTFTVELTDSTITDFFNKCYQDGTTPAEVLEGFINDLVCGSHTRGSDERMIAGQYYDRCCYGMFAADTFCRFCLIDYRMDELREALEQKQDAAADLAYYEDHKEEDPDGTEAAFLRDNLREAEDEINEIYRDYADHTADPEPMDKALQGVCDYLAELETMKGGRQ